MEMEIETCPKCGRPLINLTSALIFRATRIVCSDGCSWNEALKQANEELAEAATMVKV